MAIDMDEPLVDEVNRAGHHGPRRKPKQKPPDHEAPPKLPPIEHAPCERRPFDAEVARRRAMQWFG